MSLTSTFKRLSPGGTRAKWPLPGTSHEITSERLLLRLGQPRDWQAWRDLRAQSENFLKPWEPLWPPEALTFGTFTDNLRRQWREWKEGEAYHFLIFLKTDLKEPFAQFGQRELPETNAGPPKLIGGVSLSNMERGAAQKGRLGYWLGLPFARRGFMTEAARLVIAFGFETLLLHRIEANCMQDNEPSFKLLVKLGFEQEGFAKKFLKINGAWEDHLLWGKIKDEA